VSPERIRSSSRLWYTVGVHGPLKPPMKLFFALSLLFGIIATVAASAIGTNAERIRRGLPPLAPRNAFSPSPVEGKPILSAYHTCILIYALQRLRGPPRPATPARAPPAQFNVARRLALFV
jgi:hypothetical protein